MRGGGYPRLGLLLRPRPGQGRRETAQRPKGRQEGRSGRPSAELHRLQVRLEDLAEKVLSGEVERGVAAVAGQLLGAARACVRDSLAAREQEELVARLEELEAVLVTRREGKRWGA